MLQAACGKDRWRRKYILYDITSKSTKKVQINDNVKVRTVGRSDSDWEGAQLILPILWCCSVFQPGNAFMDFTLCQVIELYVCILYTSLFRCLIQSGTKQRSTEGKEVLHFSRPLFFLSPSVLNHLFLVPLCFLFFMNVLSPPPTPLFPGEFL